METQIALIVTPEAQTQRIEFTRENSLKKFQTAVGGLIAPVSLTNYWEMYVNDEGILLGMKINPLASIIATEANNLPEGQDYTIFGNAVFFGGVDKYGNSKGLSDNDLTTLEFLAKTASVKIQALLGEE
jgi:hypothetical protein